MEKIALVLIVVVIHPSFYQQIKLIKSKNNIEQLSAGQQETRNKNNRFLNRVLCESLGNKPNGSVNKPFFFGSLLLACVQYVREGLRLVHVQGGSTYPPLLQRLRQGLLVHQASPRRVHQEGALTHLQGEAVTERKSSNRTIINNNRQIWTFLCSCQLCRNIRVLI